MNKSEDLKNFKVEELEQRLEMGKWKNESNYACTSGDCRGYIGASYTF
jgi:hypothetical protein|nr:hypothetical protein [uncultured Allomuricauda sp.]|tara:strand:- start:203 stop:346 length:144 start_codon:yes stop_codon:yes gene_type:complete